MRNWLAAPVLVGCALFASDAFSVSPKDLVARYAEYNGKRINVAGEVVSSEEMTVMYLPSPSGETTPKEGMLITLSPDMSNKPDPLVKRFTKSLRKTGHVLAELEGQFEGAPDRALGHQACCRFRLQVEHVVSLK